MFRQERCPKEADIGEALRANAPSPMYLSSRIADQHSKMSRFLNAYILKTCKFSPQSPLKIGTFSVGGGLRGGSGVRGEDAFARNASPRTTSLVTFLFGYKKVTPVDRLLNCNLNTLIQKNAAGIRRHCLFGFQQFGVAFAVLHAAGNPA